MILKKTTFKLPRLEYFIFWDHVEQSKELMLCALPLEVLSEDELKIVGRTWTLVGHTSDADREHNEVYYTIAKSTVVKRKKLR